MAEEMRYPFIEFGTLKWSCMFILRQMRRDEIKNIHSIRRQCISVLYIWVCVQECVWFVTFCFTMAQFFRIRTDEEGTTLHFSKVVEKIVIRTWHESCNLINEKMEDWINHLYIPYWAGFLQNHSKIFTLTLSNGSDYPCEIRSGPAC